MGEALHRAIDHHVERDLRLPDPAHAVREPRRAEPVLAEAMALAESAQDRVLRDAQIGDADLAVVVTRPAHRVDVADDLPAVARDVDQERRVGGLRHFGRVFGARDQDRELRAVRARDEPLVAVDDVVVAVGDRARLDQRRVGARDLRLGHRETRTHAAVAETAQVLLLLFVGAPVMERVHVALVGRLRVQRERTEARLRRFCRNRRHRDVPESHAAVFLRHVR